MNGPILQKNARNYVETANSKRQKTAQHLVSFLLYLGLAAIILFAGLLWGDTVLADGVTLYFVATRYFIYLPLLLAAVELVSCIYHFIQYRALHHKNPNEPIKPVQIWADWETGERSPAKTTVVFIGLILVLIGFFLFTLR